MIWRWVDKQALLLLHDESLAEHGGASGLRDEGLLDSALARPMNRAAYETPDRVDVHLLVFIEAKIHGVLLDGVRVRMFSAGGGPFPISCR